MLNNVKNVTQVGFQALVGCVFSCLLLSGMAHAEEQRPFTYTEWLVGTWQHSGEHKHGSVYEQWHKVSDTELAAESYIISNGKKTVIETIRLLQRDDGIFYVPTVHNQNEGMPVSFALKSISGAKMIFANPKHDFPKQISYERLTDDSLVAELSGPADTIINIDMRRIK